jgi:hypothetical protein
MIHLSLSFCGRPAITKYRQAAFFFFTSSFSLSIPAQ